MRELSRSLFHIVTTSLQLRFTSRANNFGGSYKVGSAVSVGLGSAAAISPLQADFSAL